MDTNLTIIKSIIDLQINELLKLKDNLNQDIEKVIWELYNCKGKIIISGVGKSGHIAKKIVSTMNSFGICSCFLHPTECMHGDFGMINDNDIMIIISNSGETKEICEMINFINKIKIIAITSNNKSSLFAKSDYSIITGNINEACNLGLAPTTSCIIQMIIGDAIAIILSSMKNIKKDDFLKYHPGGYLGINN